MALAPVTDRRILGSFSEKDFGCTFDYCAPDLAGLEKHFEGHGINAEVYVGDGTRFARMLKTVAYIAIDENDDGTPRFEKWHIRQLWSV